MQRLTLTRRTSLPIVVRSESTTRSAVRVVRGTCRSNVGNIVRYCSCSPRVTRRCMGVKCFVNMNNIIAFGGTGGLMGAIRAVPLSDVILRASYPCVTPRPRQKAHGSSQGVPCIVTGVTRVGNISIRRIRRAAQRGTFTLFAGMPQWEESVVRRCRMVHVPISSKARGRFTVVSAFAIRRGRCVTISLVTRSRVRRNICLCQCHSTRSKSVIIRRVARPTRCGHMSECYYVSY